MTILDKEWLLCGLLLVLCSCTFAIDLQGTQLDCTETGLCPSGFVCPETGPKICKPGGEPDGGPNGGEGEGDGDGDGDGGLANDLVENEGLTDVHDALNTENWWNNSWKFRMPILFENRGEDLHDYQVDLRVDTSSLISEGKMQAECHDMRFADTDGTTPLIHWIESACYTAGTTIWITVPLVPAGTKNIYLYYGNPSAPSGRHAWSGSFILASDSACPPAWMRFAGLDGKFPRGSSNFGAEGGTANHTHFFGDGTTHGPLPVQTDTIWYSSDEPYCFPDENHTHPYIGGTPDPADFPLPPYLDVIYCASPDLVLERNLIAIFNTASMPSDWIGFSSLDGKFPRGASVYGGTGGNSIHTHHFRLTTGGPSDVNCPKCKSDVDAVSRFPTEGHTHSFEGDASAADHIPEYFDVVFGKSTSLSIPMAGLIVMVTELPPLGWTRFSGIEGRFPRGASSYGGTGGSEEHRHEFSITTAGPSATEMQHVRGEDSERTWASPDHTHTVDIRTSDESCLPPYMDVIYAIRNSCLVTTTTGPEESM